MFCPNCGKELPDGIKFCNACGTPVSSPEPEEQPIIASTSETPLVPAPAPAPTPVPAPAAAPVPASRVAVRQPEAPPEAPKSKKNLVMIGIAAVAVVAVVVAAVLLLPGLLGGGSGSAVFAYLNDDGELMYLADLKEKTEPLELTDEAGYSSDVGFSPDGKTVYFTDSDSTLYSISTAELQKGGRPERVSRDVESFFVLGNGKVLYRQSDSNGGNELSVCDGAENYQLIRDYYDYRLGDGQNSIYYTEYDEDDDTLTLYRKDIADGAKEEKLLKGATSIYSDYDASLLVYGVEDDMGDDGNTLAVYSCAPGGDKNKLVDDVYNVYGVSADGGNVSFYYTINDVQSRTLYDFVTDDQASADAATLSAGEPVYPDWSDYSVYDIYTDGTTVYYLDYNDTAHALDLEGLFGPNFMDGVDATLYDVCSYYYYDIYNYASDQASAAYDAAYADYEARYDGWYAAQNREYIREDLKSETYGQSAFSLYHFTGSGDGEEIASQVIVDSDGFAPYDGVFLYQKAGETAGKVADVADLSYYSDIYELRNSGSEGGGEWYQNVGGKESVIDLEDAEYIYDVYVLGGKEVLVELYDGDETVLQSYTLGEDSLTFSSTVCDGDDWCGPYWAPGGDALYIFTDTSDESYGMVGDFCIYKDGELETVAKEVYGIVILGEGGTTYAITDYSSYGMEMSLLGGEKPTVVSDEIEDSAAVFLDAKQFLYISDDDLYLWDGKESRRIATDVVDMWSSMEESYRTYSAY